MTVLIALLHNSLLSGEAVIVDGSEQNNDSKLDYLLDQDLNVFK